MTKKITSVRRLLLAYIDDTATQYLDLREFGVTGFSNPIGSSFFSIAEIQAEQVPEPEEIGNFIEEVVHLARHMNF
ncbi:hypothetical protein TNCV_4546841 [Trichonephila clavipes]|nr:hypothetical protein TNCV_4546841 [Trichonephila clavipes]